MCGRVIQSSGPLRLGIVEGLDVSDNHMDNIPPRYNAAPSQELLVIRLNHKTGEVQPKLTEKMVKDIRKLRRSETVPEIMRKTGLSKASVYRALSRGAMHSPT